jgi:hypothetical protein
MYENAQYYTDINNQRVGIRFDFNGVTFYVPLDPANTDYANLMALKESGNWPAAEIEGYSFDSGSMCYYILPLYKLSNLNAPETILLP